MDKKGIILDSGFHTFFVTFLNSSNDSYIVDKRGLFDLLNNNKNLIVDKIRVFIREKGKFMNISKADLKACCGISNKLVTELESRRII